MKEEQRQQVLRLLTSAPLEEEQEEREALEAPAIPLDAQLQERLVAAVLRRPETSPDTSVGTPVSAAVQDELAGRRQRRPWKRAGWIAALAAAAAVVFVMRGALVSPSSVEEVPLYALEVTGVAEVLGSATASPEKPVHLVPGAMLRIKLRPARAPAGQVEVQAYLLQGGQGGQEERLVRSSIQMHPTEFGVFGLAVSVDAVPELRSGASEILFIVGRKGGLPSGAEVARIAGGGGAPAGAGWQLLRRAIVVETR